MAQAYVVGPDSTTRVMKRVQCTNEAKELQELLECTPDLLPGEQIRPEDPCRWLTIKREMPVQDPGSAESRWSVDLFLADHTAIPTFVECKRFADTRARREVVGQMLDYAANGHFYWDREILEGMAAQAAKARGKTLSQALKDLSPDEEPAVADFFESLEHNLREGQLRLVFFMERSPYELRSLVDFLNRQMERTEVLLVEAQQFELDGLRVVIPQLFGYTEEARRVKRTVTVESVAKEQWTPDRFFADAQDRLDEREAESLRGLYELCSSAGMRLTWGRGKQTGSFSVRDLATGKSLITVQSDGVLYLNFGYLSGPEHEAMRRRLASAFRSKAEFSFGDDALTKYPGFHVSSWAGSQGAVFEALSSAMQDSSQGQTAEMQMGEPE